MIKVIITLLVSFGIMGYLLFCYGIIFDGYKFVDGKIQKEKVVQSKKLDFTWDNYIKEKTIFESNYYKLLTSRNPTLEPYISLLERESSLSREIETKEFYYVFRNHPELINRNGDLGDFVSFNMKSGYINDLMKDQDYQNLVLKKDLVIKVKLDYDISLENKKKLESIKETAQYKEIFDRYSRNIKFLENTISE